MGDRNDILWRDIYPDADAQAENESWYDPDLREGVAQPDISLNAAEDTQSRGRETPTAQPQVIQFSQQKVQEEDEETVRYEDDQPEGSPDAPQKMDDGSLPAERPAPRTPPGLREALRRFNLALPEMDQIGLQAEIHQGK